MKLTEQDKNPPSEEGGLAYVVKIMLRDFGFFIILPCATLIIIYVLIPLPRSLIVIFSLLIFYGLLVIIFAVTITRHVGLLILHMKRAVSRIGPEYFGQDEERLLDKIIYIYQPGGQRFRIWIIRIYGTIIAGFFAYKLGVLLSELL